MKTFYSHVCPECDSYNRTVPGSIVDGMVKVTCRVCGYTEQFETVGSVVGDCGATCFGRLGMPHPPYGQRPHETPASRRRRPGDGDGKPGFTSGSGGKLLNRWRAKVG